MEYIETATRTLLKEYCENKSLDLNDQWVRETVDNEYLMGVHELESGTEREPLKSKRKTVLSNMHNHAQYLGLKITHMIRNNHLYHAIEYERDPNSISGRAVNVEYLKNQCDKIQSDYLPVPKDR